MHSDYDEGGTWTRGSMYEDWLVCIPNQELTQMGGGMEREQTAYMASHGTYQSAGQRNV